MSVYSQIHRKIRDHQEGCDLELDGADLRLMKLSEEVGEVMEAFIGQAGANKRKGFSHTELDVANELCDVVITAMVALHDWVEDPEAYLESKIAALRARVELEGS
jgi:hypothetical protein